VNDDNKPSFLDTNTLLAIVLSFAVFIGWQFYMNKHYPAQDQAEAVVDTSELKSPEAQDVAAGEPGEIPSAERPTMQGEGNLEAVPEKAAEEVLTDFSGEKVALKISSRGMGFRDISLHKYTDRSGEEIRFGSSLEALDRDIEAIALENETTAKPLDPKISKILEESNFSTGFGGDALPFEIVQSNPTTFVGKAEFAGGTVTKNVVLNDETYSADVEVRVEWTGDQRQPVSTLLYDRIKAEKSSLFRPSYEGTDIFHIAENSEERSRQTIENPFDEKQKDVTLTAIASQYFALALEDKSGTVPEASSSLIVDQGVGLAKTILTHKASPSVPVSALKYTVYFGPKDRDLLLSISPEMPSIIDYGFFGFIALPILKLLKFLFSFIGNWGFAIIALTVIIRLLLLPIAISSMRSMKKMQKIQPMLKDLKTRYKDDPQRMNAETMALMKKEGANPLGGCLPMVAQIPVFFALYSVLGVSIELYKAPFILWIKDLSIHDPYYVLPVMTSLLFFLQTKLTPSSMDPNQKKIMMFMPLMFGVVMLSMPAGLMAYFLTNNLFGIGQQFYINREKSA